MERQAAAERIRRAAITEAEARIVLAQATKDALALVQQGIGTEQLTALYLLGEKYIATLQHLGASANAKTVILPADLPGSIRR